MIDRTAPFPMDWNAWRVLWGAWLAEQEANGTLTRSSFRFPGKNFLADEILGVWRVEGRTAELSETTFPSLEPGSRGAHHRFVGVTFGTGAGMEAGGVAGTFEELERALGISS
jgi:hypothetical protein